MRRRDSIRGFYIEITSDKSSIDYLPKIDGNHFARVIAPRDWNAMNKYTP